MAPSASGKKFYSQIPDKIKECSTFRNVFWNLANILTSNIPHPGATFPGKNSGGVMGSELPSLSLNLHEGLGVDFFYNYAVCFRRKKI